MFPCILRQVVVPQLHPSKPKTATASKLKSEVSSCGCLCAVRQKNFGVSLWHPWRDLPAMRRVSLPYVIRSVDATVPVVSISGGSKLLSEIYSTYIGSGNPEEAHWCHYFQSLSPEAWSAACRSHHHLCSDHWVLLFRQSSWSNVLRGLRTGTGWCRWQPWGWLWSPATCQCQDRSRWWPTLWVFGFWLSSNGNIPWERTMETALWYSKTFFLFQFILRCVFALILLV